MWRFTKYGEKELGYIYNCDAAQKTEEFEAVNVLGSDGLVILVMIGSSS